MFRKYVIITLAAVLFLGTGACTSKKAEDDSADVESTSTDGLESADAIENNSDLDTASVSDSAGDSAAGGGGDDLSKDLGSDDLAADGAAGDSAPPVTDSALPGGDLAETPPPTGDMAATDSGVAPSDSAEPAPDSTPAPDMATMDSAPPPDPGASLDSGIGEAAAAAPAPVTGSLKKVNWTPRQEGKTLLNAIYIARQGDTAKSIAQKVFGSGDRVKELCKHNSYNCSRDVKVGDKFYYNSPQRPTDDATVKTFFEDAGVQPEVYMAKAGDNIRKVGKELLGDSRSWMELWALNDVESKSALDEGTQLKYWPRSETAAPEQTVAESTEAAPPAGTDANAAAGAIPPDVGVPPPSDMASAEPPPADMAAAEPPPPPPADSLPPAPDPSMNAGMAATTEPPPPPPPPPPTDTGVATGTEMAGLDANDPNQTMALGIGAILLLAAAALFISIRKRKQRRAIDFNTTTQTQID